MQDLNVNPKLPFEDNTFDVITNVVCTFASSFKYYFCAYICVFAFA